MRIIIINTPLQVTALQDRSSLEHCSCWAAGLKLGDFSLHLWNVNMSETLALAIVEVGIGNIGFHQCRMSISNNLRKMLKLNLGMALITPLFFGPIITRDSSRVN